MANLGIELNVNTLPQGTNSYDPIPAGWYQARVVECEPKDTKPKPGKAAGQYLKMQWEILGPNHAGRKVFSNMTLRNENDEAERIGMEQIRSLMEATGLATLSRTEQVIGKTCEIKVSIRPARDQWEASNDVKGFRAAGGSLPTASASNSAPAATAKKPWEK